jgi:hypothetical protein
MEENQEISTEKVEVITYDAPLSDFEEKMLAGAVETKDVIWN